MRKWTPAWLPLIALLSSCGGEAPRPETARAQGAPDSSGLQPEPGDEALPPAPPHVDPRPLPGGDHRSSHPRGVRTPIDFARLVASCDPWPCETGLLELSPGRITITCSQVHRGWSREEGVPLELPERVVVTGSLSSDKSEVEGTDHEFAGIQAVARPCFLERMNVWDPRTFLTDCSEMRYYWARHREQGMRAFCEERLGSLPPSSSLPTGRREGSCR